jgi:hypothetical protein
MVARATATPRDRRLHDLLRPCPQALVPGGGRCDTGRNERNRGIAMRLSNLRAAGTGLVLALFVASGPLQAAEPACPPAGQDGPSLQALKANGFALPDDAARRTLALGLLPCLGDPDPAMRDGIAYEALTAWLRAGDFDTATLRAFRDRLYAMLDGDDPAGFRKPFAALVLSEVARTDRVAAWMTPEERTAMVGRAAAFVEGVRDYRGYDARDGWRHGVAHGADWLMQLALNPMLEKPQLDRILAAIASQAVPPVPHAYVFGEPDRLARPLLFVARRDLYSDAEWQAWFAALARRTGERQTDTAGWLARRHDLMAFASAVYIGADDEPEQGLRRLQPAAAAVLTGR